jgi:hypothetical protein
MFEPWTHKHYSSCSSSCYYWAAADFIGAAAVGAVAEAHRTLPFEIGPRTSNLCALCVPLPEALGTQLITFRLPKNCRLQLPSAIVTFRHAIPSAP